MQRHRVDALLPEVRQLQEEGLRPLDLGCATLTVDTTDGYEPGLPQIVDAIVDKRPRARSHPDPR